MRHPLLPVLLCCSCAPSVGHVSPPEPGASLPVVAMPVPAATSAEATPVYRDATAAVESRVADLLGRMTPLEKSELLSGSGWMESHGNERLGIPVIKMADGPMGVRNWTSSSALTNAAHGGAVTSTAFPAGISMAATWDPELASREGRAIAQQVKALGRNMILAPTVNINRTPLWGRNFEGYGEDPYLAAKMAVAYIQGVQGEGVIATVKHFVANNQEHERHRIDEQIDQRALHEIYFPAFKAAIHEADVWSVMSAYNKVNGRYCAENSALLSDVLKKAWGFQGFVVSDWGSTYSTVGTVQAGMDLEMPGGEPMRAWSETKEFQAAGRGAGWLTSDKVASAVADRQLSQAAVDDAARRILRVMFKAGLFDKPDASVVAGASVTSEIDNAEHRALAREAATRGMVLLKNANHLLPLDPAATRRIAVIGPNAATARPGGGGSSQVRPKYVVSPLEGIQSIEARSSTVTHLVGVPMPGESIEPQSNHSLAAMRAAAAQLARESDLAVVVVGNSPRLESESFDRPTMDLPAGQDALIEAVAAANHNTIVVVVAGAPVTMRRWVHRVPAILYAWYGGQESGNAIADLLFGRVNPSGKLPVTFPKRIEDSPAYGNYPGENLHVEYAEGIYVGYRGFDKKRVKPLFVFGHGLSYSKFSYANLRIAPDRPRFGDPVVVSLDLHNASGRAGIEVVQLYLHDIESSVDRPEKELKAFRAVSLEPGVTKTVSFSLDDKAMSFYDPRKSTWVVEPGRFEVRVGASSSDIRLKGTYSIDGAEP